jgi:hypothetical protein
MSHVAHEAANGLGTFKTLDRSCQGTQGCRCRRCTSASLSRGLKEPYRSQVQRVRAEESTR